MPASPTVYIVLDPVDTKACAELVGGLHRLGAGRVVCHATHTGRGVGSLGLELLIGLGKRFDAARTERVYGRQWQLAELWMAAERTATCSSCAPTAGAQGNGSDSSAWPAAAGSPCG